MRSHRAGAKTLRHPLVGEMDLTFEVLDLTADDDLSLLVYTAEPGTPSAEALALLGSWAATELATEPAAPADRR